MLKKISAAADFLRSKIGFEPRVGVILGTGLNSIAEMVENPRHLLSMMENLVLLHIVPPRDRDI